MTFRLFWRTLPYVLGRALVYVLFGMGVLVFLGPLFLLGLLFNSLFAGSAIPAVILAVVALGGILGILRLARYAQSWKKLLATAAILALVILVFSVAVFLLVALPFFSAAALRDEASRPLYYVVGFVLALIITGMAKSLVVDPLATVGMVVSYNQAIQGQTPSADTSAQIAAISQIPRYPGPGRHGQCDTTAGRWHAAAAIQCRSILAVPVRVDKPNAVRYNERKMGEWQCTADILCTAISFSGAAGAVTSRLICTCLTVPSAAFR